MQALVIGGTGPTGHFIVNGLLFRGYSVAMLHSGRHELAEIPPEVEHIHTDPWSAEAVEAALGRRRFDLAIVTYGRLRALAAVLAGRVGRLISVGGVPAYRGYMNPGLLEPAGLPVPLAEDSPLVRAESEDGKGFRIVRSEQRVFELHPDATHFRYPYVYGPYQLMPREWCIVRRVLDRRERIILPEDGLTLHSFGYVENVAHALLLAVDRPEASAGEIYHCADEEVLSLRQVVLLVAAALDHRFEIVSMPYALARPARPLVALPSAHHRVLDLTKLKQQLGYRDVVPAREALARTARWLVAHPPDAGGTEEYVLQDPFDYVAEDALIDAWQRALASMPALSFEQEPGYTLSYSGPGGRASPREFE